MWRSPAQARFEVSISHSRTPKAYTSAACSTPHLQCLSASTDNPSQLKAGLHTATFDSKNGKTRMVDNTFAYWEGLSGTSDNTEKDDELAIGLDLGQHYNSFSYWHSCQVL